MRILQAYPKSDYFTGAAIQMFELARALRQRGHEVVVVTQPSDEWPARARAAGLVHHSVPMTSGFDLRSAWALARIIRQHRIEVLHAHKGRARSLALLARLTGAAPVLVLNRGVSFPLGVNRFGYRTSRVHAVVAVCESIKRGLVAQGVPADKITVIYSATDTERFHPKVDGTAIRRELGIAADEFLLTQIGTRSWKGNDDVMAAMATVQRQAPRARVLFVGARRPDVHRERARAAGLDPGTVRVLGYRTDIPEILAASDCCVDASWTGLGLTGTLREALAVQTAVIGTALEGNPELVIDGTTGLLVPPRDRDALARAILTMIEDPGIRHETARAGRALVEERFSLHVKVHAMEALYRRLLAARAT